MSLPAIDLVQWRALVVASLRIDVRSGGRTFNYHAQKSGGGAFFSSLLLFALMGVGASIFVSFCPDRYLSATAYLFVLAFVIASSLLIEYQAVVLAPADYRQLSFQPVTSPTFFAARLTSVAVYVMTIAAAFSLAPLVAFAVVPHGGLLVAAAAACAAVFEAVTVMLTVVALYVGVLRLVPAARLTRALSYLQLLFGFVVYGSYMIVPMLLGEQFVARAALPKAWWTLANPASWFAGWVTLAGGERSGVDVAGPLLSLAALAASAWIVAGRLSIDYAERLGEMDEAASLNAVRDRGRPMRGGWLFHNGEPRAVALLVRAQFRYDQRFRLTVLSVLPLTLVYLFSGLKTGSLDPFAASTGAPLVYLAVMLFPTMIRGALGQSDAHRAAWIFHGTPASRPGLVVAVKQFVVVFFLVPYLLFLGAVYVFMVGKPLAIVLHVGVLGLISHAVLVVDLLLNPDIPFAAPVRRSGMTASTIGSLIVVTFIGTTLQPVLHLAYATTPGTIALVAGLAALNGLGEVALRHRLTGLDERTEFEV